MNPLDLGECILCGTDLGPANGTHTPGRDLIDRVERDHEPDRDEEEEQESVPRVPDIRQKRSWRPTRTEVNGRTRGRRPERRFGRLRPLTVILVILVLTAIGAGVGVLLDAFGPPRFSIDGKFREWDSRTEFAFKTGTAAPDLAAARVAMAGDSTHVYIRLAAPAPQASAIAVLIDSDGDALTGYAAGAMGADQLASGRLPAGVIGLSSHAGTNGREYSWKQIGTGQIASSGKEIELRFPFKLGSASIIMIGTFTDLGQQDLADYPIGLLSSVVVLEQSGIADVLAAVPGDILRIQASAFGQTSRLVSLDLETSAGAIATATLPGGLSSTPVEILASIEAPGAGFGDLLTARVRGASTSPAGVVWVTGSPARSYALTPPAGVIIDGAFGDWVAPTSQPEDLTLPGRVDIVGSATNRSVDRFSAMVVVRGGALAGVFLPEKVALEVPGPGNGTAGPPVTGEDSLLVELDYSGGDRYRLVVSGRSGSVSATSLERLVASKWEPAGAAEAGADAGRIETGATLPGSLAGQSVKARIVLRGWDLVGDTVQAAMAKIRLAAPSAIPQFLYPPIRTDVSTGGFRISWVSDQAITGRVEYCSFTPGVCDTSNFPGGPITVTDAQPGWPSGAAMIEVSGLSSGVTYHWRALADNGQIAYSNSTAPYPSVTTKTSIQLPGTNPAFLIQPFHDVNNNYVHNPPPGGPDINQTYFLAYFNITGAEPLVGRGNAEKIGITTSRLRYEDAVGNPRPLAIGDLVRFYIAGLYDDGGGYALWVNTTATYLVPDPVPSGTVSLSFRTENTGVPERGVWWLFSIALVVGVFAFVVDPRTLVGTAAQRRR